MVYWTNKLKYVSLFLFLIYILGLAYINVHEFNHHQIFSRYGIESRTNIDYLFLSGVTIPYGDISLCNDSCKLQHELNDIFGYYLVIFIMSLFSLYIIIMGYNKWLA